MKKLIAAVAMMAAAGAAYAACTSTTIFLSDGKTLICTTCCDRYNICTTSCR